MQDYKNSKEARETAEKYRDILHAKRPVTEESLLKHPRMTLENRAKIFSPFAALRGYEAKVAEEGRKVRRVELAALSDEEQQVLSDHLAQVRKGDEITLVYFDADPADGESPMGFYRRLNGRVEQIDPIEQTLRVGGQVIGFGDIRG